MIGKNCNQICWTSLKQQQWQTVDAQNKQQWNEWTH